MPVNLTTSDDYWRRPAFEAYIRRKYGPQAENMLTREGHSYMVAKADTEWDTWQAATEDMRKNERPAPVPCDVHHALAKLAHTYVKRTSNADSQYSLAFIATVCANEPADGAIRDAWLTLEHWLATVAEARPTDDDNRHIVVNNVVTADIDYTALRECIVNILEEHGEQEAFTEKSLRKLFRDVLKKHSHVGPPGPTGPRGSAPDEVRMIVREELHRAMHTPLEAVGLVKAAPHNQD